MTNMVMMVMEMPSVQDNGSTHMTTTEAYTPKFPKMTLNPSHNGTAIQRKKSKI